MVAIVKAAAAIAAIGNPEYAVHRAHRAANTGADRATNQPAHRTGRPVAFISALLRTAHNALGVTDMGRREQCERECRPREKPSGGRIC